VKNQLSIVYGHARGYHRRMAAFRALPTTFVMRYAGARVGKHAGLHPNGHLFLEIRALLGLPVELALRLADTGQLFPEERGERTNCPE